MQAIYDWMKNIIIFMILVTVIMNLLGKSSFKKYVGIITGLLLVLFVIKPIISFAGDNDFFNFSLDTYNYKIQSQDMTDMIIAMEQKSSVAVMNEYKQLLMDQTNKLLEKKGLYITKMNVVIDEDIKSLEYGSILHMNVEASYIKQKDGKIPIDPITIERIQIGGDDQEEDNLPQDTYSPMEINIKNVLADFYNIESYNINISIREDHNG